MTSLSGVLDGTIEVITTGPTIISAITTIRTRRRSRTTTCCGSVSVRSDGIRAAAGPNMKAASAEKPRPRCSGPAPATVRRGTGHPASFWSFTAQFIGRGPQGFTKVIVLIGVLPATRRDMRAYPTFIRNSRDR
ncbi:MAG TPA: hypothetical protein VGD29_11155 [Actinoplanes sp.]|jgi:hypothetical protein